MSPQPSSRVYIGGLHGKTRERDVEKFFNKYGKLREILLKNGYGFVEFDDERDAEDACHDLDGKELLGERLRVELARGSRRREEFRGGRGDRGGRGGRFGDRDSSMRGRRNDRFGPPARTDYKVHVDNLSSNISWQDLKDAMRRGGEVTYADKRGEREGVVEFASKSDMINAIKKCDGMEVQGRRIKVTEASGRSGGGGGRGRSSSGSRSRSRSPRARKDSSGSNGSGKRRADRSPPSRSASRSVSRSRSRSRPRS